MAGRVDGAAEDGQGAIAFRTSALDTPRDDGQAPTVGAHRSAEGIGGADVMVATFVKRHGAADATDAEHWEEAEVARTVNVVDAHRQDSGPALVATPYATSGGGEDPAVVANTLKASGEDGGRSNDAEATYVAATLTAGSSGEGVSPPGRRHEDDENMVAGTVRSHARPGSNSATLAVDSGEGLACGFDPLPDGRRYAACGDGVASPVTHWLGLRLVAVMRGDDPDAPTS